MAFPKELESQFREDKNLDRKSGRRAPAHSRPEARRAHRHGRPLDARRVESTLVASRAHADPCAGLHAPQRRVRLWRDRMPQGSARPVPGHGHYADGAGVCQADEQVRSVIVDADFIHRHRRDDQRCSVHLRHQGPPGGDQLHPRHHRRLRRRGDPLQGRGGRGVRGRERSDEDFHKTSQHRESLSPEVDDAPLRCHRDLHRYPARRRRRFCSLGGYGDTPGWRGPGMLWPGFGQGLDHFHEL